MNERFQELEGFPFDPEEYDEMYNLLLYIDILTAFKQIYGKNKSLRQNFRLIFSAVLYTHEQQVPVDAEIVGALNEAKLLRPVLTSSVQEETEGFVLRVPTDIAMRDGAGGWTQIETNQIVTGFIVELPGRLPTPPQTTVLTLSARLMVGNERYTLQSDLSRWVLQRKQLENSG